MKFLLVIALFLTPAQTDPAYELYLAKIAAAEALVQIDEIGEAKMHLATAPEKYRGWEWNYLNALTDNSSKTVKADDKGVYALAVSPDGKTVATGGDDGKIRLWNAGTLTEIAVLEGHKSQVTTLDFSPDGKLLASGSNDKTIKIWDTAARSLKSEITDGLSQKIYEVKFHPEGKQIAAASWDLTREPFKIYGFAKIYDVATGKMLVRIDGTAHPVSSVDYSKDGSRLAVGDWGALVQVADSATGKILMSRNLDEKEVYKAVDNVRFDAEDTKLISVGKDRVVRTLDAKTGETVHETDSYTGHRKKINTVAFAEGRYATAASDSLIKVWDAATNAAVSTLRGHTKEVTRVTFSPDDKTLYSVSADGFLKSWDLAANRSVTFDVCDSGPWSAPVSTDSKYLVAACSDKKLGFWSLDGKLVHTADGIAANYAAFLPNGDFVSVGHDSRVAIWGKTTGAEKKVFTPHGSSLYGVDVSKTGLIAAGGDNREAIIYDGENEIKRLKYEKGHPRYVKFTPDGKRLVLGFTDGAIDIVSTANWESLAKLQAAGNVSNLAISKDGKQLLAGASNGAVTLWNLDTYELLHSLRGHDAAVFAIDFTPDGKRIATGSYDQTVKIWDPATGRPVMTIRNFETSVYTLSFVNEGRNLLVTQTDGIVKVL